MIVLGIELKNWKLKLKMNHDIYEYDDSTNNK